MPPSQPGSDLQFPRPIILGAGLTAWAISRALSASGIMHVLVGARPTDMPRLGESLNAEGSLEIARQFPEHHRFFFNKQRLALFFNGNALSFDSVQLGAGRDFYPLIDYPSTVQLLHVDRVGFDQVLFETAIAQATCHFLEDRPAALDYRPAADRVDHVLLASGASIASSYVFDATNQARFVARKIGVQYNRIGTPQRVVFAHYRAADKGHEAPPPWTRATALLRLDSQADPIDGLAWCIPLGDYVSVGVSVDPEKTSANASLLLDWVDRAYATRGIDVRGAFPRRGAPVDLRYEHYTHERCFGANWLLAGPTYCQVWFPSASGVATGLVAARLAPDLLKAPARVAPLYQAYVDQVAGSHTKLEWLTGDAPWSVPADELRERSQAMISGNVKRLSRYLALQDTPTELAFGDAFSRMYEQDRLLANPLRVDTAPTEAQATRLFAKSGEPDPWMDAPIHVPVLTRPDDLTGPSAILALVDMLSGRRDVGTTSELLTPDVRIEIDQFQLQGVKQWEGWVTFLRGSRRVTDLDLVPGALSEDRGQWKLTAQWRGVKHGLPSISSPLSMTFSMSNGRVASIQTQRVDYTFVVGDVILRNVAFAVLLGQLAERSAA